MSKEHEENIKKEFAAAEGVSVDAIQETQATEQPKEVISELGKVDVNSKQEKLLLMILKLKD